MVIKWKKIARKCCDNKIRRRGLLISAFLALFFCLLGMGMNVRSLKITGGYTEDLFAGDYANSRHHREDVERSIRGLYDAFFSKQTKNAREWGQQEQILFDMTLDQTDTGGIVRRRTNVNKSSIVHHKQAVRYVKNHYLYYYIWDGEKFEYGDGIGESVKRKLQMPVHDKGFQIVIAFTPEYMSNGQEYLDWCVSSQILGILLIIFGVMAFFPTVVLFVLGRGNRKWQNCYSDIAIVLCAVGGITGINLFEHMVSTGTVTGNVLCSAGIVACSYLVIRCVYAIVQNFLGKEGKRQSLIYTMVTGEKYYKDGFVICNQKRNRVVKWLYLSVFLLEIIFQIEIRLVLSEGLWFFMMLSVFLMGLGLLALINWCYRRGSRHLEKEYNKLMLQLQQLLREQYQNSTMLEESSVFYKESLQLSMLGCQIQESVQKGIQAEKMKIDLITNVSHDLKTPLTSIISYIDLLEKEQLSPVGQDYVKILQKKADRLKRMITDVFVLAKASSGNLEIQKTELDFGKLVIQTLAELSQMVEQAPVKVVTQIANSQWKIYCDGEKMYRVIQNLLDNALKYAMPGTRVYVMLEENKGQAVLRIKNVSSYEMNFTKEEVMGRFFRGDSSRSTEGSGLGLAIAKEFMEYCGGTIDLHVDGDVFEVELHIPLQGIDMITE